MRCRADRCSAPVQRQNFFRRSATVAIPRSPRRRSRRGGALRQPNPRHAVRQECHDVAAPSNHARIPDRAIPGAKRRHPECIRVARLAECQLLARRQPGAAPAPNKAATPSHRESASRPACRLLVEPGDLHHVAIVGSSRTPSRLAGPPPDSRVRLIARRISDGSNTSLSSIDQMSADGPRAT